jgi:hypothetical protein
MMARSAIPLRAVEPSSEQPTIEDLLREAIRALDEAEATRRDALDLLDRLRRRYRAERPGTFVLPSLDQLRTELFR